MLRRERERVRVVALAESLSAINLWDSRDGTVAWEGMQEILYARDRISKEPVTFRAAVERTAGELIKRLP